jgi:hypothetical protein
MALVCLSLCVSILRHAYASKLHVVPCAITSVFQAFLDTATAFSTFQAFLDTATALSTGHACFWSRMPLLLQSHMSTYVSVALISVAPRFTFTSARTRMQGVDKQIRGCALMQQQEQSRNDMAMEAVDQKIIALEGLCEGSPMSTVARCRVTCSC